MSNEVMVLSESYLMPDVKSSKNIKIFVSDHPNLIFLQAPLVLTVIRVPVLECSIDNANCLP